MWKKVNSRMEKTITVLVGLPGSGKSWLGSEMLKASQGPTTLFLDDVSQAGGVQKVLEAVSAGAQHIILSDPHLCVPENRLKAEEILASTGYIVKWMFFENAPLKCEINVRHRQITQGDSRKVSVFIRELSKQYIIPMGQPRIRIWQPSVTIQTQVKKGRK